MLWRRLKNNPRGARKLRALGTIVQKEKGGGNWPDEQLALLAVG
jgi:hypothetical protein